jgi:acyl carrier protein
MSNVEDTLRQEIASILNLEISVVTPDAPLRALGMDSLRFVELLVSIEKVFGLNLLESGLTREDFQSVRSLATCITRSV